MPGLPRNTTIFRQSVTVRIFILWILEPSGYFLWVGIGNPANPNPRAEVRDQSRSPCGVINYLETGQAWAVVRCALTLELHARNSGLDQPFADHGAPCVRFNSFGIRA